jgi:hypothetical protein
MRVLHHRLARLVAGLAGAAVLVFALGAAVPRTPAHRPATSYPGTLQGVSVLSPSDAWAVGKYATASGPKLILHWNGSTWRQVASPDPGGGGTLYAVSARSPSDAWAVGSYCAARCGTASPAVRALIMHWNGTAWVSDAVPTPHGGVITTLRGVSARSASDAWTVGWYCLTSSCYPGGPPAYPLTLHWNGSRWARVPSPDPGGRYGATLNAVTALSGSSAWAVGGYGVKGFPITGEKSLVLHWNGTTWAKVASPSRARPPGTVLTSISALSPSRVWAAGWTYFYQADQQRTMILRGNGGTWSQVASPSPGPDSGTVFTPLTGISALSPANAWAVGSHYVTFRQGVAYGTLVLHWNGTSWTVVPSPSPAGVGGSSLNAVSAASPSSAWAVGSTGRHVLILHWNGARWAGS